jgi:glycosyltransferase involved in cell wall biosynthesis
MKADIIVFTNHYPYGTSEGFLYEELQCLSASFYHILLCPLDSANKSFQRTVPENVKIFSPPFPDYKSKILLLSHGIFKPTPYKILIHDFIRSKVWTSRKKILRWFVASLFIRTYLPVLKRILSTIENPDNVLLYFFWGLQWSQLVPCMPLLKNKIAIRLHGSDLYEFLYKDYIPLRELQLKRANLLVTVSETGKTYLTGRYPHLSLKIYLSRLGTTDYGWDPSGYQRTNTYLIVSCSNLVPVKRIHLIPRILKFVNLNIHWVHFGNGPEIKDIKKFCKLLPSNVSFEFKGFVPTSEIIRFYQEHSVDLFINVSASEGVPVSIMEALSFGIPVIATDVGGTGELISNKNGLLIPKDFESEKVAGQIIRLLTGADFQDKRENARKTWETYSNATVNYPEFANLLFRLKQ